MTIHYSSERTAIPILLEGNLLCDVLKKKINLSSVQNKTESSSSFSKRYPSSSLKS